MPQVDGAGRAPWLHAHKLQLSIWLLLPLLLLLRPGTAELESKGELPAFGPDAPPVFLNIGGVEANASAGSTLSWLNVNAQNASGHTDIIREMHDLHGFPNDSVSCIYASHILEHAEDEATVPVLQEWLRVLRPGGLLLVSVPDFELLAREYLRSDITEKARRWLLKVIFGGGIDHYDHHRTGFSQDSLSAALIQAGFVRPHRVGLMRFFHNDMSTVAFGNKLVSINMAANKLSDASAVFVNHDAEEYLPDEPVRFTDNGTEVPVGDIFPGFFL